MLLVQDKARCCSCGACQNICQQNAIDMVEDQFGFLYPQIDSEKCIKCGECVRICDFKKDQIKTTDEYKALGVVHKDLNTLKNSSSGGAFFALAQWILDKNGIVYGCAWNKDLIPEMTCVDNTEGISVFHGSKYVQAKNGFIYRSVQEHLKRDRYVLFSGTPCQCAALRSYLKKEYDKLYCVEIICHGVPNVRMYVDFLGQIEKRINGKVKNLNFRDKKLGWGALLKIDYITKSGRERTRFFKPEEFSYYYNFFYKSLFFRESCYKCKYANRERESDFTIGDFWGGQKICPAFSGESGISVLIAKGKKAISIIPELQDHLEMREVSFDDILNENGQLGHPSLKNTDYDTEIKKYFNLGSNTYEEEYRKTHRMLIIKGKLKRMIPIEVKRFITRKMKRS